jgi:hypothetical protein
VIDIMAVEGGCPRIISQAGVTIGPPNGEPCLSRGGDSSIFDEIPIESNPAAKREEEIEIMKNLAA